MALFLIRAIFLRRKLILELQESRKGEKSWQVNEDDILSPNRFN